MKMILVSAGDAITAKLVQEAGFDGIWISGFEASARLGLADNGSITMSEMLAIAKPIVDAVTIPVYVDVDTGYGNFKRTIREFECIDVAGICVQDDEPDFKCNSLWGEKIPLLDKRDFANKIHVPHRINIIARTEAIIRGYGMADAILRLEEYAKAGADILLPHTRNENYIVKEKLYRYRPDGKEEIPFAIVPTKFPHYTNQQLFDMGYSMVIWANQTERIKIKATRECLGSLKGSDCAEYIEKNLSATLDDMKALTPDE